MEETLKAEEAKLRLLAMLQESLGASDRPSLLQFWPIYKTFVQEDFGIKPEDDFLLFECSRDETETETPSLYVGFMRQFSFHTSGGGYSHMEQTGCNFYYSHSESLGQF